jgi:hypothetical protein
MHTTTDPILELQKSKKFQAWGKRGLPPDGIERSSLMAEKHYSPDELADLWGVSAETIRNIFRDEPGVLKIGKTGSRYKRGYVTLRIPQEVAERIHTKLSA